MHKNRNKKKSTPSSDTSERSAPEIRFICKIERECTINSVISAFNAARIGVQDCYIEQTIPQDQFTGRFKFVRIVLPNQNRADEIANSFKKLQTKWKLSRKQPTPPNPKQMQQTIGSGVPRPPPAGGGGPANGPCHTLFAYPHPLLF